MKYQAHSRMVAVALGAVFAFGTAAAQTAAPDAAPPTPPGQVMSDVAPLPAEDRSSAGAVVVPKRGGAPVVGRTANRVLTQAEAEAERAGARNDDANDLRRMGAGGLIKK